MNSGLWARLLFTVGLGLLLASVLAAFPFGQAPMTAGQAINTVGGYQTGAANLVTSVLLAYRGLDTLGELTILFVAATAAGMVLTAGTAQPQSGEAGFVLRTASALLFPFLLLLGFYIILHGHISPGGGFQGGAILAAAYFLPLLGGSAAGLDERASAILEGGAGAAFIVIGLMGLSQQGWFLAPLLGAGEIGALFSAGSLPLLYIAVGLKVGAELAALLGRLGGFAEAE